MKAKKFIGIGILLVAALIAVVVSKVNWKSVQRQAAPTQLEPVTLTLAYGGEKSAFLANPKVLGILQEKYGLTLKTTKIGSIEMVTTADVSAQQCLWPSNGIAVELARQSGKPVLREANAFNSPIVFYAWDKVTEALVKKGIVELRNKSYYVIKSRELIDMVSAGKKWKDEFGLNVYGPIKIFTTDPVKSNSGNMWAGLLANLLNGGNVVDQQTLPTVLPKVLEYFRSMGMMERSSGDIFENFLSQGMGARPMIVGYENQLVEFVISHPEHADLIKSKIRVLYPEPTVFASHPLISLKPECKRLEDALRDTVVQDIAWREHGFRSGLVGVTNDPSVLAATGIPETIDQVIPMPSAEVMTSIINALNNNVPSAPVAIP